MTEFDKLTFSHANVDGPVRIIRGSICGYNYSEKAQATLIYCQGQTIFPVKETMEQVDKILERSTK